MDDDKTIENIKEMKNIPEKNQWKLVKSNSDSAESDISRPSHSGAENKSVKFGSNKKYEDKTIQVNDKKMKNSVAVESSSNLSSNVGDKVQVKFREGPDEVYNNVSAKVETDQDTSDLLCNYVVLRDDCNPSCQKTTESNGNFRNVVEHFRAMQNTGVSHHLLHQKSTKLYEESNKGQITCEHLNVEPSGDAFQFFGDRQNNNQGVFEKVKRTKHRYEDEKKGRSNSGTVAPCRSIKRLKSIFGQEQYSTSSNHKKEDQCTNEQHPAKASTKKYNNIQSNRRDKCLYHCVPMKGESAQSDFYPAKTAAQRIQNNSKFTIYDGFHNSRGFNLDFLPEYNSNQYANGVGDKECQNKSSYGLNDHYDMNDDKRDITLGENRYRITNPLPERIEVYYFDHGSSSYFRTTDHPPPLATDLMIEKTDQMSTKFWAGAFGFLHIFFAVFTSFCLQLYRFILISSVRPLFIGTFQVSSDYFLKPFLATLFNAIIQPFFILFYNIATSFRNICKPIARGIGFFLEEIANILRAIRLVEVKNSTRNGPFLNPFRNSPIEI